MNDAVLKSVPCPSVSEVIPWPGCLRLFSLLYLIYLLSVETVSSTGHLVATVTHIEMNVCVIRGVVVAFDPTPRHNCTWDLISVLAEALRHYSWHRFFLHTQSSSVRSSAGPRHHVMQPLLHDAAAFPSASNWTSNVPTVIHLLMCVWLGCEILIFNQTRRKEEGLDHKMFASV